MSDMNTGSAPAGNPAGGESAPAASTSAPAATGPWFDSFQNADIKAWTANKNFESPETAMQSYLNLEKLLGHEKAGRTVVLPGENATPDEINAFLGKIGRPDKPDGYEMPTENIDADFAAWAKNTFHEAGIPAKAAKTLVDKWQQLMGEKAAAAAQDRASKFEGETALLKREWGAAFQDKAMIVDRAVREFGLGENELAALRDAWGPYKAMTFFEKIGSGLGEGEYVSGGGSRSSFSGAMTPDQAKGRIKELQNDQSFIAKYIGGDVDAKQTMERLHQWAYGG